MRRRRLNEDVPASRTLRDLFRGRVASIGYWNQKVSGVYIIIFKTIKDWPDVRVDFNDEGKIEGFEFIHNYAVTDDSIDPVRFARNSIPFTKALDEIFDFISSHEFDDAVEEVIKLAN